MPSFLVRHRQRRSVRRAVRTTCQAVALDEFRLIGDRILDLSPRGLLLACDDLVETGQELLISFKAPGDGPWIDVEAEVARVIGGWRPHDPGYAAGLRFTHIERRARGELLARLAGFPPPVPHRPVRTNYAETVARIHAGVV